jgi:hypothetical protein
MIFKTSFPAPADPAVSAQQRMAFTGGQLWGSHLPADRNANATFYLSLDTFRTSTIPILARMGFTPA